MPPSPRRIVVASKARTDALFVDQRNTVLSDGRNTIRTIDEQIADLKAHGSTATSPAQRPAALDAAGAARTVASTQVEQLATATPETWDVQRSHDGASHARGSPS